MATLGIYLLGIVTGAVSTYIYAKCGYETELREIRAKVEKLKAVRPPKPSDKKATVDEKFEFYTMNELNDSDVEKIIKNAMELLKTGPTSLGELCKVFMPIVGANYDRVNSVVRRVSNGQINLRSYPVDGYVIWPNMHNDNKTLSVVVETEPPACINEHGYVVIHDSAVITKIRFLPPQITSLNIRDLDTDETIIQE